MSFVLSTTSPYTVSPYSISPVTPLTVTTSDTAPYVTSINLSYSKPLVSVYENVEADPKIHRRVTKYYYGKTLDDWMYDELLDLLNYLVVRGNQVELISSISQYNPTTVHKNTQEQIDMKVDFIEKYFFKKDDMTKILHKFIEETGTSWYHLVENEYFIRQMIKDFIKKRFRKAIADKKSK